MVRSSYTRDAPVCSYNQYGCGVAFQCSVEVRKALYIKHVNFVDKQDAWDDFGFAFFPPFSYLGVDLLANFSANLTRVAGKQGEETLR